MYDELTKIEIVLCMYFFLNTERGKVCQTILVVLKFCILPLVLEHRAMFSTVSKSCDFHSIRAKIEVHSVSYSFLIFTTVEPSVWFRAFGDPLCLLGHHLILFSLLFLLFFISGDCKKIGISFTDFTAVCHYCSFYKQVYMGFFSELDEDVRVQWTLLRILKQFISKETKLIAFRTLLTEF